MASIEPVAFEDDRAHVLWAEQQAEIAERYGEPDIHPDLSADGLIVSLLALADDTTPVGTVLARWSQYHPQDPGAAEVKRLYVVPGARGQRLARGLMAALEEHVWAAGATRIVLETGTKQPEAIRVYEALGYDRMVNFGPYAEEPESVCMDKLRPTP